MSNLAEAKKYLLINVISNVAVVVVTSLIGIWLTPYLINRLGVAVYGIVPLIVSVVNYLPLITLSITSAVSRFVAIETKRQNHSKSNIYFNTAIFSIIGLCSILALTGFGLSFFLTRIFQIPAGYESAAVWLLYAMVGASFLAALTSPFLVSTFIWHRFVLDNTVKILSRIVQVSLLVSIFAWRGPNLGAVGLSYFAMAVTAFIGAIFLWRRLSPELRINLKMFRWHAMREMGGMGTWITLDQLGTLLYYNINMVVINIFLGSEKVGHYAPIVQLAVLVNMLGDTVCSVFTPITVEYVAANQLKKLAETVERSYRFMGLVIALPIGILCGLSNPLLDRWLGPTFADLHPLMWLVVGPGIINIVVRPSFAVNRGLNKVRLPAIATIIGGASNLILAVIFVRYTSLGLYGVSVATLICLMGRNFFFTPAYSAHIIGEPRYSLYRHFIPGIIGCVILAGTSYIVTCFIDLSTIPRLICSASIMTVTYVTVAYIALLSDDDKKFIKTLVQHKRAAQRTCVVGANSDE